MTYEPETEAGDEQVAETSAETTEAVSTDTGSVDENPVVETAAESTEESVEDAPDVVDWNGELESVQESAWFNSLSENVSTGIL